MAITVKHNKVSTIPDTDDTSLVRPSDWNADHTLVGTIDVANGGTGASTLTGYVKGNGTSAMTAVATVPSTDITGLGTMSTQNSNNISVTGGTINGTTIGATSASSVNATTITGQTGVLRGTGQNYLLQSNTFNTTWTTASSTVATTVATLDPFGGSNAWLVTASASGAVGITQTLALANLSSTYTLSVYAKAGTSTWLRLFTSNVSPFAWFNLSTGAVGTVQAGATATITSVGNGWYRCSISSVSNNTIGIRLADADNNTQTTSGTNLYLYGAQVELASSTGTYTATTTTAVYGTPTLSFSGVSTIGLESTGALFVQPAGTGALQAQATTSTTAGGNARGANAVDWQTSRNAANQVASGTNAVVGGGANNRCSAFIGTVVGGSTNAAASNYSFIGGGTNNAASSGDYGTVVGGQANSAAGYYNFIGGGFTNAGTSGSAVTTQSGTMNATTAVTLSGSNANIKVGQLITGTSIASYTYVAAISGTSLTLSQAASGSSTSTLSFFTPHGVVVGGGNNQATGSYSFIGGGGDAGTAANRNVASGDWSTVGGGQSNTASGIGSVVAGGGTFGSGGSGNTASGVGSAILGGWGNTASGTGSSVISGNNNTSNASRTTVLGSLATARAINGIFSMQPCNSPISASGGINQTSILVLARQTTDATATALASDSSAAGTTNQVILPNNSAYFFTGEVISGVTGGGNTKGWTIEGVIKRGANAAATTLVGVTVTSMYADVGAATWTIAVTADTTNGGLRVTFTGQASTTIRTVCQIRTTEMTY
jgi:hypothetical protein